MLTVARPPLSNSAHWYLPDGTACHEVPRADGKGMRNTTLADARKLGLLPSVTTVLQCLAKPGLTNWLIEQAILAITTAPDLPGETIDQKIKRVLPDADQERDAAANLGTRVHQALADYYLGNKPTIDPDISPMFVAGKNEVDSYIKSAGLTVSCCEERLVGDGYAGCTDLILSSFDGFVVMDFKTCKSVAGKPMKGFDVHRLQLGAYSMAWATRMKCEPSSIITANVYISTTEQGRCEIVVHGDWREDYAAFVHLMKVWQWQKGYRP